MGKAINYAQGLQQTALNKCLFPRKSPKWMVVWSKPGTATKQEQEDALQMGTPLGTDTGTPIALIILKPWGPNGNPRSKPSRWKYAFPKWIPASLHSDSLSSCPGGQFGVVII